jgi:PAS domain S-box-containing protein
MAKHLRTLVVEDSEDDALLLTRELGLQGYDLEWTRVQTAPDMSQALGRQPWDVVLSDYKMPAFSAPEALEVAHRFDPDLPFIVVSGTVGEDVAVETMKAGAHDYLLKGSLARLGQAIERQVRDAEVRREHRRVVEKLGHLNCVLRAIRNVNQLIVAEKEPNRLIEKVCDLLVETRGYTSVLCILIDDNQLPNIASHRMAERGGTPASKDAIRAIGLTPCIKQAVNTNQVVLFESGAPECSGCPLADYYPNQQRLAKGLSHDGTVYGALSIALPEEVTLDPEELDLIDEMAGDIGFALFGIKQSEELAVESALVKASERKFRSVFHGVTEGILVADSVQKHFVMANEAICQMLGFTEQELLKLGLEDIHSPEHLHAVASAFESQACGEIQTAPEVQLRRKDGSVFYADINAKPVGIDGRELLLACFRDVTERVESAATIKRNEERFRKVFEGTHDLIALVDDMARAFWANPAERRIFGEDVSARPDIFALVHQDDAAVCSAAWKRLVENNEAIDQLEWRTKRQDGSWACLVSDAFPLDLLEGRQYCVVSRDVTEEEKIEGQKRAIFESTADFIMLLDRDHRVQLINRTEDGLTLDRVVGTPLYELADAENRKTVREALDRVVRDGKRQQYDTSYDRPDGTRVYFHSVVNPVILSEEITGSVVVSRDMSERKLMQTQIAQSDRLASMGMLAAGVAHEINNPLAYVLYNLESLTEDLPGLSSALRKLLEAISERVGNAEWSRLTGEEEELLDPAMLQDILDRFKDALDGSRRIRDVVRGLGTFSRVDQDRLVPVALMPVIEVAIDMSFNEIKYRAKLVKEYGTTSMIMANDGRLSQVFLNLLINAAHAITEGDVEGNQIRVRTWEQGDEVFAEVQDTGKGIPKEQLPSLFEPFFTTKDLGVGTGLGLPISKNIIEEYGGRIEVESEIGKGTRFVVRLPVNRAANEEDVSQGGQVVAAAGVRGRILVVDDEAGIRATVVRMLKEHDVVQTGSGHEARKLLEADQAFDLILCDMMMPLVSGVDLHEWLLTTHPDLANQVVFTTGGAFTPRARAYLAKVGNMQIEKPFDVANLKKIVGERVVAHRKRGS